MASSMKKKPAHHLTASEQTVINAAVAIAKNLDRIGEYGCAYDNRANLLIIWRDESKKFEKIDAEAFVKNRLWFDRLAEIMEKL